MSGGCNDFAKSYFGIAARSIVSFCSGHLYRNAVKSLIGSLIGLAITYMPVSAKITVDMMEGTRGPSSIAITDFPSDDEIGSSMARVIAADLEGSGLFLPIDKDAFVEKISNPDIMPRFADWTAINARALVTGRVTKQPDGRLLTEFRLWDTVAGQQLDGQRLIVAADNWRRVAHVIADATYQRLAGEKGLF
jgi:TolB protein